MACEAPGNAAAGPCAVGLTGGLASGKSTAACLLLARGVAVLDADRVVHELYRPGEPGAAAVLALFGDTVLDDGGGVDRAALAERVLGREEDRRRLEAVVHPLVRARVHEWLAARPAAAPAVVEAALLVETGSYRDYDVLVVVSCDAGQQLERAVARGMAPERARELLGAQLPLAEKCAVADVVIDNSGAAEALPAAVDEAWQRVLVRCGERRSRLDGG